MLEVGVACTLPCHFPLAPMLRVLWRPAVAWVWLSSLLHTLPRGLNGRDSLLTPLPPLLALVLLVVPLLALALVLLPPPPSTSLPPKPLLHAMLPPSRPNPWMLG